MPRTIKTKWFIVLMAAVVLVAVLPAVGLAQGTPVDLSVSTGSLSGLVKGAYWEQFPGDSSAGTGNFNTYLSLQAPGNNTIERGYNSSLKKHEFDENTPWTKALPLSAVPLVEKDGNLYREFVLDVNQTTGNHLLSLDYFQVWQTDLADLSGYDEANHKFPSGANLIYDIDGGFSVGDNLIEIEDVLSLIHI